MSIGIIAIGRNEGDRLKVCLASALRESRHVVYVDSGSTDGSVKLAREIGAQVVELDLSIPFTAARARNAGFEHLLSIAPGTKFVQFVDGDCEIVEGWVAQAQETFSREPRAGVVCGRRRERFPSASIYNNLCDLEWNTPIGKARACGGDAMIRVQAFQDVRGYNPDIIAGEEPEMCLRLRAKGWEIWRIDAEMTLHDAAMTKFSQWWKRALRSGHAFAEGYAMHGAPPERHNARQVRSIWVWGLFLPDLCVFLTVATAVIAPRWCWIPALGFLLYPLLMAKVARSKHSLMYGFFTVLGKFPQLLGMLKYRSSRARGQRSALIEYKSAVASTATE